MLTLKSYLNESVLNTVNTQINESGNVADDHKKILEFLDKYYFNCKLPVENPDEEWIISDSKNSDGKYEVKINHKDRKTCIVQLEYIARKELKELTNGMFVFADDPIMNFDVHMLGKLKTLSGCPKMLHSFRCEDCRSLRTLKDGPIKVLGDYDASYCDNLKSIEGVAEYIGGNLDIRSCKSLKSLKNDIKYIGGNINAKFCKSLDITSLDELKPELKNKIQTNFGEV